METISDMFTAKKFNWERDHSDEFNKQSAPFPTIYQAVRNQLNEDRKAKPAQKSVGATSSSAISQQKTVAIASQSKQLKQADIPAGTSIFQEIHKSKKSQAGSQVKGGKPGQQ